MTAWLVATGIGVLVGTGTWLALRARTFDVVLGLTLLTYGVNLFIFAMGRVVVNAEPILRPGVPATLAHYADPLPQALVLTAIVISFAMTAVLLALALKGRFDLDDDRCDAGVDEPEDEDDHGPDPEHADDRGHAKGRPPAHAMGREGEPR